jgi:hypothetical protein
VPAASKIESLIIFWIETMSYTMRGLGLFNSLHKRIAFIRGKEIYDGDNRRVATINGNYLYDSNNKKMMTVRGAFIYDADNTCVGSLADAQKKIIGAEDGMQSIALWYCFIR